MAGAPTTQPSPVSTTPRPAPGGSARRRHEARVRALGKPPGCLPTHARASAVATPAAHTAQHPPARARRRKGSLIACAEQQLGTRPGARALPPARSPQTFANANAFARGQARAGGVARAPGRVTSDRSAQGTQWSKEYHTRAQHAPQRGMGRAGRRRRAPARRARTRPAQLRIFLTQSAGMRYPRALTRGSSATSSLGCL